MGELHHHCGLQHCQRNLVLTRLSTASIPAELCRKQHQQRPEALTACVHQMPRRLRDKRVLTAHSIPQQGFHLRQASVQPLLQGKICHGVPDGHAHLLLGSDVRTAACGTRLSLNQPTAGCITG